MTVEELIADVTALPWTWIAGALALPPVLTAVLGLLHGKGRGETGAWRIVYATVIYAVCLPGIFAAVLTAYSLFFLQTNLLEVNLLVYVAPIVSMIATLAIAGRNVDFDAVPGFDRLSGLMVVLAIVFVLVLAIQKTRIWVVFGGSIVTMFLLVGVLVAGLQWGWKALTGRREDERH